MITLIGVCDAIELEAPYEGAKSYALKIFLSGDQPDQNALDAMARQEIGILQIPDVPDLSSLPDRSEDLVKEQRAPEHNDGPAVWDLVMEDFRARDTEGRRKYGTPLQPNNGRDPLVDAYQEALDLVVYLRQEIHERRGY